MTAAEAPVSTSTVAALMRCLGDQGMSVGQVAEIVAADSGLAARVLALANSASFGLSRQVTQVHQAVALVGTNMTQTLAIAGACDLLDGTTGLPHARRHAVEVACAARLLAGRVGLNPGDAFAAGLLHDLGEILLWRRQPEPYAAAHAAWADAGSQLRDERGFFGTDHALVAREQLAEWRVPGVIVDAVGDHHRPDLAHRDLSTAVVAGEELADPAVGWSARFEVFGLAPDELDDVRRDVAEQADELAGLLAR